MDVVTKNFGCHSVGPLFFQVVSMVTIGLATHSVVTAAPAKSFTKPSLQELKKIARRQLSTQSELSKGDLVTQSTARKVVVTLRKHGWAIKNESELLGKILPDNDFLVQQFVDKKGREFLRRIENLPGGIDRVDRLARMPQGRANVNALIRKIPNGSDWIAAMTTTRRGKILGKRLSNAPTGTNFNLPTGRIYQFNDFAKEIHAHLIPVSTLPATTLNHTSPR